MLHVYDSDEEFLVGSHSNVLVTFWGRMTVERIRRIAAAHETFIALQKGTGFGGMSVILPRRHVEVLPGVADEQKRLITLVEPHVIASGVVVEGDGMLASGARLAINAVARLKPWKYTQKLFGTVDEAADWIVPLCAARSGEALSAKDLTWDITAAKGMRY